MMCRSRRLLSGAATKVAPSQQTNNNKGLAAYRRLLRSSSSVFGGDDYALVQARNEIRKNFEEHRFESDESKREALFRDVEDVVDLLKNNVLQGKQNERGNFEVKLKGGNTTSCADAVRPIEDPA